MASPSKEENILRLIFENSPLKHWHFEEVVRNADMTRAATNKWLNKYQREGLIIRVKEKSRFPYFTSGKDNMAYKSRKKIFALNKLYECGLISHLMNLRNAKTIIIFGSIAKGDWYKDSDIDIFIFGSAEGFDKHKYENKIGYDIELHVFAGRREIRNIESGLMNNVINGYLVKGKIQDVMVDLK